MSTLTLTQSVHAADPFDADEIRRLVAKGKASGLIREAGTGVAIKKNGTPVTMTGTQRTQWMDVDPGMAAHWLQNNFINRLLSDDVITGYARDMANGNWFPTHQGIAFNDLDHLIDGQHRLHAIIRCGLTIRMMVTFGLPSVIEGKQATTMDAVDRGRPRSVADQLKIQHGMKNGSAIAMITASLAGLCQNERTRRLSVGQTLDIYRAFKPAVDWVIEFRSKEPGLKAKGVLAACAFAVAADVALKARCHQIFTGDIKSPGSPLQLLRSFLISDDAKLLNRGTDRGIAELTLVALQLDVAGESVERLELTQAGLHAFRALQPERVAAVAALFALP